MSLARRQRRRDYFDVRRLAKKFLKSKGFPVTPLNIENVLEGWRKEHEPKAISD